MTEVSKERLLRERKDRVEMKIEIEGGGEETYTNSIKSIS